MRILWLKTELLHPVDKGGKIRTYNMLKELKRDHQITYIALDDSSDSNAREQAYEYCHDLICIPYAQREKFSFSFYADLAANLLSRLPYALAKYRSDQMRDEIIKRSNADQQDVVICDFLAPALNVPNNLSKASVLFQHNVEAMIWKRHFEVQTDPLKKRYLRSQWRKMERAEREMCQQFDSVIAVSSEDREEIKQRYLVKEVFDVPTGVDTEFFTPSGKEQVDKHNLVFTGSMDWLPNEDAIQFFIGEILPIVRRTIPDVSLTVVGRNPYPGLVKLSEQDPSIIVTGRVDDVRPYMERAAGYVVPLRIGGGTRLKIYEAMSMSKAIVSTTVGAEGLPVTNRKELLLADTPEDFAAAVVELLHNPQLAARIGAEASQTVRENFGWSGVTQKFAEICERAIRKHAERRTAVS